MLTIFWQVLILFAFIAIGYILSKTKVVKYEHSQILSALAVYVFFPSKVLKTFALDMSLDYIKAKYPLLLLSLTVTVVFLLLSRFGVKLLSKKKYEQVICEYSLVVPSYAYMGSALVDALLGEQLMLDFMIACLPITVYIYTIGYAMLTKSGMKLKKILSPTMVCIIIGSIIGLCGIPVPELVSSILTKASACISPISMLMTGIVIAEFKFKDILGDKNVYIISFLRLIVMPLALGFALKPFCTLETIQVLVVLFALPCGLNTIVFPRLVGEDCRLGAGMAVISNTACIFTIPLILSVFHIGG